MLDFVSFVKEHIGRDVQAIADHFKTEIDEVASSMGHDWSASSGNVTFHTDGTRYQYRDGIRGLEKADDHRIYLWPKAELFVNKRNAAERFEFPVIVFANTRQSYLKGNTSNTSQGQEMGTALFNSLPLLFDRYNDYRESGAKPKPTAVSESHEQKKARILAEREQLEKELVEILEAEIDLFHSLDDFGLKIQGAYVHHSLYLQEKGVEEIARTAGLRCGTDHNGFFVAFELCDSTGTIVGIQRIYDAPFNSDGDRKLVTKGAATNGAFKLAGPTTPSVTEEDKVVYICEGLATALSVLQATGRMVAVDLYNSNHVPVNEVLAELLPDHKRVTVCDNDSGRPDLGNSGVEWGLKAVKETGGFAFIPRPMKGSDANDVHRFCGIEVLQSQFQDKANYVTQREAMDYCGRFNLLPVAA